MVGFVELAAAAGCNYFEEFLRPMIDGMGAVVVPVVLDADGVAAAVVVVVGKKRH